MTKVFLAVIEGIEGMGFVVVFVIAFPLVFEVMVDFRGVGVDVILILVLAVGFEGVVVLFSDVFDVTLIDFTGVDGLKVVGPVIVCLDVSIATGGVSVSLRGLPSVAVDVTFGFKDGLGRDFVVRFEESVVPFEAVVRPFVTTTRRLVVELWDIVMGVVTSPVDVDFVTGFLTLMVEVVLERGVAVVSIVGVVLNFLITVF